MDDDNVYVIKNEGLLMKSAKNTPQYLIILLQDDIIFR